MCSNAWEINPGARSDVVVAIVDSGLNTVTDTFAFYGPHLGAVAFRFAANPDLVTDGNIVRPFDFVYGDRFPLDLLGHGTHVAGTIAQTTNNNIGLAGIAYNVKLMPLKVIGGPWDALFVPMSQASTIAALAEAIAYAANNGAHVINLSLGAAVRMPAVEDAIRSAVARGAFIAISAGNEGKNGNRPAYPAAYADEIDGAMAVGAVNRSLKRAAYSSFHPYVEICAPGGDADSETDFDSGVTQVAYRAADSRSYLHPLQAWTLIQRGFRPRFDKFYSVASSGTSMAAPHVAAVAALLRSQGITNREQSRQPSNNLPARLT